MTRYTRRFYTRVLYLTDALEIFERLGTLIEPEKVRKELEELP